MRIGGRIALPRCTPRTPLLELRDDGLEIGIAAAKAPCKPVPTALGDPLAISENLELSGLPRLKDSIHSEALLDKGHETRDLGFVVLSCRAVHDLDLHRFSNLFCGATWRLIVHQDVGGRKLRRLTGDSIRWLVKRGVIHQSPGVGNIAIFHQLA